LEILEIKSTPNLRLDWKPTIVVPVGDTQYGSEACSSDRFKRWIRRLLNIAEENDRQILFIGMGDYTDSIRPSLRKKYLSSGLEEDEHFSKSIVGLVHSHIDGFCRLVEGTEGKWIGMLEGHHFFDFGNGTTSDTIIADRLGARFLGDCTRVHLTFERTKPNSNSSSSDFQIWAHHGEGSGAMPGAPLNRLNAIKGTFQADAFLMAHQHKSVTAKVPYCFDIRTKDGYKMVHKDISLTCTGGWLQGYQQDSRVGNRPGGHYPEQRLLVPLSLGGTRLELFPIHEQKRDYIYHEVVV
jgi:hypothetical protein